MELRHHFIEKANNVLPFSSDVIIVQFRFYSIRKASIPIQWKHNLGLLISQVLLDFFIAVVQWLEGSIPLK